MKILENNGYPTEFIKKCDATRKSTTIENNTDEVLPYLKVISGTISRELRRENIKVEYKPIKNLNHYFPKTKDKPSHEKEVFTKFVVWTVTSLTLAKLNVRSKHEWKNTN